MKGSKVSREGPSRRVRVPKPPDFFTTEKKKNAVVLFAEGTRSGRTRAGSGRRVGPPARPRTTRTVARRVVPPRTHRGARLSRRAMRPATSAGYPASGRGRRSRVSERWRASASARRKRGKRTLYAPGLGRLHLAGGPVGSGGAEVTGRGQLRLAKRAPRGVARPMRGCRHRDGGCKTRSARVPDRRPRVARDASGSTNALGGHGHLAGHEGGGHGHGGHVCLGVLEGSGEVRALECIAHASAQPFYR